MGIRIQSIQESAEALGFSTIDEALNAGYTVAYTADPREAYLTKVLPRPEDIFSPENTYWTHDVQENGERQNILEYDGDIEKLAKETNISKDDLEKLLKEYEDMSKQLIKDEQEIAEAKKGQY